MSADPSEPSFIVPSPTESADSLIRRIESLIRRDPGRRGLIGADGEGPGIGELLPAAKRLVGKIGNVCLLTGFFIPDETSPHGGNAETDGPPGTTLLAAVLVDLGYDVRIVTDVNCGDVVHAAAEATGLSADIVLESPLESDDWRREFLSSDFGRDLAHLIAIERVGPGHTSESIRDVTEADVDDFESLVPADEQNRCRNMRGEAIDRFTGDLHKLFEDAVAACGRSQLTTIGVGDGGNEIGMGRFRWRNLYERLPGSHAACVPCQTGADNTVVAGTSNWGAMALAAAVATLTNRIDILLRHTEQAHGIIVQRIVEQAGAVDGVTRRREATVDGLPFLTYMQPWAGIRRELGIDG